MVVKRLGPMSVGKIFFALYAIIGLFIGLCVAAFSMLFTSAASTSDTSGPLSMLGAGMGLAAIIIAPIVYGIIGFIGGLIMAAVYNLAAGMMGGMQLPPGFKLPFQGP